MFNRDRQVVLSALMVLATAVACGETFYWVGGDGEWLDYGTPGNWRLVTPDGVEATRPPSASDINGYPQNFLFADLGGQSWTLGTYNQYVLPRLPKPARLCLTNGTLTVSTRYATYEARNELWNGATFVVPSNVAMEEAQWNAGYVEWTIHSGGRLELKPKQTNFFQSYYLVEDGGTMVLDPKILNILGTAWPNYIQNRGTLDLSNGLSFAYTNGLNPEGSTNHKANPFRGRDGYWGYFAVDHFAGTLKLGGTVSNGGNDPLYGFFLTFRGGTVEVVKDVTFSGFDCAVSNNAEVVIKPLAGATLDMTGFNYGTGASLVKRGAGYVRFGARMPDRLSIEEGLALVENASISSIVVREGGKFGVAQPCNVSQVRFDAGSVLSFGSQLVTMDASEDYEQMAYEIDSDRYAVGVAFFQSEDAAIRRHVAAKLREAQGDTYDILESGNRLLAVAAAEHVFDTTKGLPLDNPNAWSSKVVPTGLAVVLRGAGEVTLTAESPAFASIELNSGAQLTVKGGAKAAPIELPELTLRGQVKLLIGEGSCVSMTRGLSCAGSADDLPVFEVASTAELSVRDPAYPNRGIYFSNVDFRLYGRLTLPDATGDADYLGSQLFFGYATAGETAHLALTIDGGTIVCCHKAAAYVGNRSLVSIASPAVGGRVCVVGDILLRNYQKLYNPEVNPGNPVCNYANSGYSVGVNNPVDEPFTVIVDHTVLVPGGPTRFGGAATVKFRNGGDLRRPEEFVNNSSMGHTRGAFLLDKAVLEFDGGRLMLDHASGANDLGKGFTFTAGETDHVALKLAGGAKVTVWDTYGNAKGVCQVTDGIFNVPRYLPPRYLFNASTLSWYVPTSWTYDNTPAFQGFGRIDVERNGCLRFDASDEYIYLSCDARTDYPSPVQDIWLTGEGFWEWHRKTALEIPVSGAGDVKVVNTLAGQDFRNRDNLIPESVRKFDDIDCWSMNLVVRSAANTCTGEITADPAVKANLYFANGANWAGTVKANANVRFGDPIVETDAEHPATPVAVDFQALDLAGDLTLRVWKTSEGIVADRVNLATAVTGSGSLAVAAVEGELASGDQFVIGTYPAEAALPKIRKCGLKAEPIVGQPGRVVLKATFGRGLVVVLR